MKSIAADLRIAAVVALGLFAITVVVERLLPGKGIGLVGGPVVGFLIAVNIRVLREHAHLAAALGTEALIARVKNPLLRQQAESLYSKQKSLLKDLEQSRIHLDSERAMMEAYYSVFEQDPAEARIDATSLVSIGAIWERALGKRALQANANAVRKGTKVRRVFIFHEESQKSSNEEHLRKQVDAGIEVYCAQSSQLNPGLAKDFLVTASGGVLIYETGVPGGIEGCTLIWSQSEADGYRRTFEQVLAAASRFT